MKLFNVVVAVACLAAVAIGCGVAPSANDTQIEKSQSALAAAYQTVPGHNVAVTGSAYSCNGWSYRVLFSIEQHQDPGSPTGWYAAVGPSSVAATGVITDHYGNLDVSADAYLQCSSGIIPVHVSGTYASGNRYNEVYGDYRNNPISCTLTTVLPASWHLPNPALPVHLLQYDWNMSTDVDAPGGTVFVDIDIDPGFHSAAGNGFCRRMWHGGGITEVAKFTPPPLPPAVFVCTGDWYTDWAIHGGCVVPPPDCTIAGHGPCPPPPDAT